MSECSGVGAGYELRPSTRVSRCEGEQRYVVLWYYEGHRPTKSKRVEEQREGVCERERERERENERERERK